MASPSDSSASTTPTALTPDSTGSSPLPLKKSRRQTAFYPNLNATNKPLKPFSRSAAKRQSVMALGSIEHLQYYFTKTGLSAEHDPSKKAHKGLVPAIGGMNQLNISTSNPITPGEIPELRLPPTPAPPEQSHPAFPPYVKTYETDPETLLPGVIDDLTAVSEAWEIHSLHDSHLLSVGSKKHADHFDVLGVLQVTTKAIRSVRNYVVSLPSESAGTIRAQFRAKTLGPGPIKSSGSTTPTPATSSPDPLTLIRRSALEALTVLRELEERCRLPLSDEAYDAQSDGGGSRGGHSRVASPEVSEDGEVEMLQVDADTSMAFSLVHVQGRHGSVPVWEEEDEDSLSSSEEEEKERWDQRLVLGSGWLYRQDVKPEDLAKERKVIEDYLDMVDEVLFNGKRGEKERGWERERKKAIDKSRGSRSKKRRTSAGDVESRSFGGRPPLSGNRRISLPVGMIGGMKMTEEPPEMEEIAEEVEEDAEAESEESIEDDELPEWARRHAFMDSDIDRAHALLSSLLPPNLLDALAPPSPRETFLDSLSSGQLLCVAYNTGVRRSKRPWGYVSRDAIHDIIALEKAADHDLDGESKKRGWTFRRTDNLRLWVGALGLRYMLPISIPSSSTNPPKSPRYPGSSSSGISPISFDAKVVAGKTEGWDTMLENVLLKWVNKVVEERRMER